MNKSNKDWTLADGDYEAEYDEAIKYNALMEINANTVLNIMFAIFSIVVFVVALNFSVKI